MLQHDRGKVRISGKMKASFPDCALKAGKYSQMWHEPQMLYPSQHRNHQPRIPVADIFPGPEVHPGLGPHAVKALGADQVILFMEDGKGSGVPVLGRRVPIGGFNMAPGCEPADPKHLNEEPVVGRRSHRLAYHNLHHQQRQQHHQQQQTHNHQQQRLMIKSHQHHKSKCPMIMNDDPVRVGREQYRAGDGETSQQAISGPQIGHLRKARLHHQSRSSANIPADTTYLDSSVQLKISPLPVHHQTSGQHASRRQMLPHQSSDGLLVPAVNLMASSSCSSLYSVDECRSCCSPMVQEQQQVPCRQPCCMPANYVSYQCRRSCCQPERQSAAKPKSILAANKPAHIARRSIPTDSPEYLYLANEAPPLHRQARSQVAHLGSAAQRARSSHELCQRRHVQEELQPMRISGRNMLPAKRRVPVFVGDEGRKWSEKKQEPQLDNSVSQIYESLAAELKAKLGDSRLAPILLPPKDYDTLSRRQGRLGDIELRRSTNPKLVGSSTTGAQKQSSQVGDDSPAYSASKHQHPNSNNDEPQSRSSASARNNTSSSTGACGKPDKLLMMNSANECDSARSSGRQSHLDDGSLVIRSRSNSSSGLGSISMGAGSRNSSPSSKCSSSEDMHQMSAAKRVSSDGAVTNNTNGSSSSRVNINTINKASHQLAVGSADDNCGGRFSDSGHSDSGGQTDTLLRADSDYQRLKLAGGVIPDRTSVRSHPNHSTGANTNQHLATGSRDGLDALKSRLSAGKGYEGTLRWKGRVEIPLKVNSEKNGNTYLATKQIIY